MSFLPACVSETKLVVRCWIVLSLTILLGGTACGSSASVYANSSASTDAAADSAGRLVRTLAQRSALPGLAVAVSIGNEPVWHQEVGFANLETRTPVNEATRFRVGSISKLLTAMTLMRLAERGIVDLDQTIGDYLDTAPRHLASTSLRRLAGHLAGIRHYRGSEFLSTAACSTLRDGLVVFLNDSLVAPPSSRYVYSSYGYNLLGAVLESVTGQSFPVLVRREVLEPLEMNATGPDSKNEAHPDRARSYHLDNGEPLPAPADDLSCRWPSGGYLSTANDLTKLGRAVFAPRLLSWPSLDEMLTSQTTASGDTTIVGIGWRVSFDPRGRRYVHHGGSSNGGSAFLLVYPQEQLVVAMTANAFANWGQQEALAIASIFLGDD